MRLDDLIARTTVVAVVVCGLLDASPWAIAGGILVLTSLRSEACFAFADRYGEVLGRLEAGSLFVAAAAARSTLVCSAAFAVGHLSRLTA
jgi:hypothetical protein